MSNACVHWADALYFGVSFLSWKLSQWSICVCNQCAADFAGFANRRPVCAPRAESLIHKRGRTTGADTTLLPQSRHPPPNPTCPMLLSWPSPPPVPAPLLHSQLSPLTHSLLSLLLCASPSLSLHFLKVARSPLFSLILFISLLQLWEQPVWTACLHLHK